MPLDCALASPFLLGWGPGLGGGLGQVSNLCLCRCDPQHVISRGADLPNQRRDLRFRAPSAGAGGTSYYPLKVWEISGICKEGSRESRAEFQKVGVGLRGALQGWTQYSHYTEKRGVES